MSEKIKAEINIPLGRGKYAVIDFSDWEKVQGYKWWCNPSMGQVEYAVGWAEGQQRKKCILLHHIIKGRPPKGLVTSHKDGDGLNCRKTNLLFRTHTQNLQGVCGKRKNASSQYRGVSWNKGKEKWVASITVFKEHRWLGVHDSEIEAAKAYDTAARKHFGEHAAPNFPI